MKFKAKMDIDFNQNDLFEEKVQKATMAYAKNVSRKAMEEEINEEIARIAKNHMKKLQEKTFYSNDTQLEKLIKEEINKQIIEIIGSDKDLQCKTAKITTEEMGKRMDAASLIVQEQVNDLFKSQDVKAMVQNEIAKQVPRVVLDCIKESMG